MGAQWIERPKRELRIVTGRVAPGRWFNSNVYDGDTFLFVPDGATAPVKVRIFGIDAPEHGQDYYREARLQLARWICRQNLRLRSRGFDCYGRMLATVQVEQGRYGTWKASRMMVRMGLAWAEGSLYREEQEFAKKHALGLWMYPDPIAPWTYRKTNPECKRIKAQLPPPPKFILQGTEESAGAA